MMETFSDLVTEIDIQPQETQRVSKTKNPKRPTPKHIIIKMSKVKDEEGIFKAAREKQLATYKGTPIRLAADF